MTYFCRLYQYEKTTAIYRQKPHQDIYGDLQSSIQYELTETVGSAAVQIGFIENHITLDLLQFNCILLWVIHPQRWTN